jgi:hypothetical protein
VAKHAEQKNKAEEIEKQRRQTKNKEGKQKTKQKKLKLLNRFTTNVFNKKYIN